MKKRRAVPKASSLKAMQAQVTLLQQVVGALVIRAGGYVELSSTEIDGHEGDHVDFYAGKDGVRVRVNRTIKVVSSLN